MTTDRRIENLEKGLASARRFNRWLLAEFGMTPLSRTHVRAALTLTYPAPNYPEVRAVRIVIRTKADIQGVIAIAEDANGEVKRKGTLRARLERGFETTLRGIFVYAPLTCSGLSM